MGRGKGKSNNYIDGKELRGELHYFAKTFRLEQKEIFQNVVNDKDFIESYSEKNINKTLYETVILTKDEEAQIGLKTKAQRKKYSKEEKIKKFMRKHKFDYNRKVRFLKKFIYRKRAYKESKGTVTDNLGEMFLLLANNLASKKNWAGYTYKEEMVGKGLYFLCKYAHGFQISNPRANAFAYVTQICKNGFLQAKELEDKQSDMKDRLIKTAMEETELEKWCKNE